MEYLKYFLIAAIALSALFILIAAFRTDKPIKTLFLSALSGIGALGLVALIGIFTHPTLTINLWSVICAAVAGIPGVILMMVTKFVWGL